MDTEDPEKETVTPPTVEMTLETDGDTSKPRKAIRRRKRKLYKDILAQMEFYFSDSNIRKDKYLQGLIEQSSDGFVPIDVFSKFNKMRSITENLEDIAMACSKSDILEVSEDFKFLKRKLPVVPKMDVDECTVYVEGFPANTDHKWLQSVFQHFGKINYMSLPRFTNTSKPKGFAFVEFNIPREARKACKYFKAQWEAAHQSSEESKNAEEENQEHSAKKRKRGTSESEEDINRKRSRCDTEESEAGNESAKADRKEVVTVPKIKETEVEPPCADKDKFKKSKKKRKRKKKDTHEENFQLPTLRVMSKEEWKRWKNKYLSMQKAAMSEMKKSLLIDQNTLIQAPVEDKVEEIYVEEKPKPSTTLQFTPGAVISLTLPNPIMNLKEFKERARKLGNVSYIDGMEGCKEVYIRCSDSTASEVFLKEAKDKMEADGCILTGTEEQDYWEKLRLDREKKMSNVEKKKKQKTRGTDKIILKATEQHNRHIRFDD